MIFQFDFNSIITEQRSKRYNAYDTTGAYEKEIQSSELYWCEVYIETKNTRDPVRNRKITASPLQISTSQVKQLRKIQI